MVELQDVKMTYPGGDHEVLRDIDLSIQDGEFVFLIGPSGSGKTTIIKLLTGEIRPTGGRILVNGFDLRTLKQRQLPRLRRTLGVIFQDFRLIDDMTVYENVAFAMRVVGSDNREIRKRVPEVLKMVSLNKCADRYPQTLSGGEQQRVAIARALVNSPRLIIADEPTGNLDPATSLDIMRILRQINELGTTVLMVTHEKEMVNAFNKRVLTIRDGVLVSDKKEGGYFTDEI